MLEEEYSVVRINSHSPTFIEIYLSNVVKNISDITKKKNQHNHICDKKKIENHLQLSELVRQVHGGVPEDLIEVATL